MATADTLEETTVDPAAPYPELSGQRSLRLAFIGDADQLGLCSLASPANGVAPAAIRVAAADTLGAVRGALEEERPDVVVCLRPDLVPPGTLSGVDALSIAYVTGDARTPSSIDWRDFDRIVRAEPSLADRIGSSVPVWRSLPLPVADEHYAPVRPWPRPPGVGFVGGDRPRREQFVAAARAEADVVRDELRWGEPEARPGDDIDVIVNLHAGEGERAFEHECALALASGMLLVTEPLSPSRGLEPSIDHVELIAPEQLTDLLRRLRSTPDAYRRVRINGRRKAERFRASTVYPRLVRDLLVDVRVFGRERVAAAHSEHGTPG